MYPCELINTNTLTIQRVLPISWTTLKSLKIIHEEQKDKMFFTNLTEILNHDWKKKHPKNSYKQTNKRPRRIFQRNCLIVLEKIPQRLINDFLGDIIYITWLSILTIIILFIIYKIYPIIIAVQLMMTAHQLPPPIPPR